MKETEFKSHGYECVVLRNSAGYLCGYVGISRNHPLAGVHYNWVDIEVHGGLTYSNRFLPPYQWTRDSDWWFGFDCSHASDRSEYGGTPKDIPFVIKELESLAHKLKEIENDSD